MKLSECLNYINQALNYPALTYEDISLFFNSAVSELNTTLHTSIPTVSEMIVEFKQKMSKEDDKVRIQSDPQLYPDIYIFSGENYYYSPTEKVFYIKDLSTNEYYSSSTLKGVYLRNNTPEYYFAVVYGNAPAWQRSDFESVTECELSEYFPDDWILLWMIPYVCYKYTVRDGGTAQTFAEELTQGFQQLQETYDVPEKVTLATYADKDAYHELVKKFMPILNIKVPTRAIYEDMKHSRNTNAIFGSFYDRGGF